MSYFHVTEIETITRSYYVEADNREAAWDAVDTGAIDDAIGEQSDFGIDSVAEITPEEYARVMHPFHPGEEIPD